jgi:hypothetical protein
VLAQENHDQKIRIQDLEREMRIALEDKEREMRGTASARLSGIAEKALDNPGIMNAIGALLGKLTGAAAPPLAGTASAVKQQLIDYLHKPEITDAHVQIIMQYLGDGRFEADVNKTAKAQDHV